MNIDINNIESLLAEKKYDEVRAIIQEATSKEFSDEERGATLTGLASVYMDISNAINIRYRDALQEALAGMKDINAAEGKAVENAKLAEVRGKLNQ